MSFVDRDKQREYQRNWLAARRTAWFTENGPCVDCGTWEDLELDHVDRTTKIDHKVWSWSQVRREAELAKCVVRCVLCHRSKTWTVDFTLTHGASGYDHRGCRCDVCKAWKKVKNARQRKARKEIAGIVHR